MPSSFGRKLPTAAVARPPVPYIPHQSNSPRHPAEATLSPRKDVGDHHLLALRRCDSILLIPDSHGAAPLMICWQPIRLVFLLAQPFAKCPGILPTHVHRGMVGGLWKIRFCSRSPQGCFRKIAEKLVVSHPRLPDAEEHIRSRYGNEFDAKTVCEWVLLGCGRFYSFAPLLFLLLDPRSLRSPL